MTGHSPLETLNVTAAEESDLAAKMPNDLGAYISAQVTRAEADFAAFRTRGQSVLTVSSGLVTVLGAVLAFAVGQSHLKLDTLTKVAAGLALALFIIATVFVLVMFLPSNAVTTKADQFKDRVDTQWDDAGWDQTVALAEVEYLVSLKSANAHLANMLIGAIVAQVLGVAAVALMAFSLLAQAS
jgi:hypothetical protein